MPRLFPLRPLRPLRPLCLALAASLALADAAACPAKFIPTFVVYYSGPRLTPDDVAQLAKFDLIDVDRYRYDQIYGNTWGAIKTINPNTEIYLYEMGPEVGHTTAYDTVPAVWLNNLGRWGTGRGHPMGALVNRPDLVLRDARNRPTYNLDNPDFYLMDFGSADYQSYWSQAVTADIVKQPWKADGVFADNCVSVDAGFYGTRDGSNLTHPPVKYADKASWTAAMNRFVKTIGTSLHGQNQKLWCNRGNTRSIEGQTAWLALDQNVPGACDIVMEEGAFATAWGPPDWHTQFYPEDQWKRQVDTLAAVKNSRMTFLSHTKLTPTAPGDQGTDNFKKPVTFHQTLWYALGSFLLGRNDTLRNAYFAFVSKAPGYSYSKITRFDEYDRIDLGHATGAYRATAIGGRNLYWREFQKGIVMVNPTHTDLNDVDLPRDVRVLTHANLNTDPALIPLTRRLSIRAHTGLILLYP